MLDAGNNGIWKSLSRGGGLGYWIFRDFKALANAKVFLLEKTQSLSALLRKSGDEHAFLRHDARGSHPRGSWTKTAWSGSPPPPTSCMALDKSLPRWLSGWGGGIGFRITQSLGPPGPLGPPGSVSAGLGWGREFAFLASSRCCCCPGLGTPV